MIEKYVSEIAIQMGMKLPKVSLVEGRTLGRVESHMLIVSSSDCNVSTIVYQADIESLEKNEDCYWLEVRVRELLSRLQMMLVT